MSFLSTCLLACGGDGAGGDSLVGDGGPPPPNGGGVTCGVDEFVVTGSLDGEPVSVRDALGNFAWIQATTGKTFDADSESGGSFHAEWPEVANERETVPITGSLSLPVGAPHGGDQLSGDGSLEKDGDTVTFRLTNLSVSIACVTEPCPSGEIDGTLTGCIHKEPINF